MSITYVPDSSVHRICSYRLRPQHTLTREIHAQRTLQLQHNIVFCIYIIGACIQLITCRIKAMDREMLASTNLKHGIECKNRRRRENRRKRCKMSGGVCWFAVGIIHLAIHVFLLFIQRIGVHLSVSS